MHIPRESLASDEPAPMGGETRPANNLEAVEYPKEQTLIRPKASMFCTLCTYKTTYLAKKMARKRLYNNRSRKHPRDSKNNPKEDVHDVSDRVVGKKAQMDHKGNVPNPTDDYHEHVPDTTSTVHSEDDSCVVVVAAIFGVRKVMQLCRNFQTMQKGWI